MPKAPLGLSVEIETADGVRYRWDGDARSAQDRPQSVGFRTQRGDGFADFSCVLSRRIDRDYVDLNLLDTVHVIGHDGSIAYEGRIAANPRSIDSGHSIQVEAVGWMAHGRDKKFREIYADRDLKRWQGPSTTRKANLLNRAVPRYPVVDEGSVDADKTNGNPALQLSIIDLATDANRRQTSESWYDALGIAIGSLYYEVEMRDSTWAALTSTWLVQAVLSDDEIHTNTDTSGDLADGTATKSGTVTASGVEKTFATLQMFFTGTATSNAGWFAIWKRLIVFGNHGLTKRGTAPDQGFYASDVITNIASRFCPKLDTSGVEDTSYVIGQIAYHEPTDPFEAFVDLNSFHNWELAVWENRKLHFHSPSSLDDYDWEVRLDDPGTRVSLQGDSTERLANGIVVTYSDLVTGNKQTVTPDDNTDLADTSETNPANKHGLDKWIEVDVPFPTIEADAVQWGRAALAEFNTPSSPGRITVQGHIRDRAGNWQPGWKPRAGERVSITNHPNDRARRITSTSWNHTTRTMEIEVEQDSRTLETIANRIGRARQAAGLT